MALLVTLASHSCLRTLLNVLVDMIKFEQKAIERKNGEQQQGRKSNDQPQKVSDFRNKQCTMKKKENVLLQQTL